jgi:isocitrate lyase
VCRWWKQDRWVHTYRNYTAADVATLRGSIDLITPTHYLSKKLYWMLRKNFEQSKASYTYGALDTVQAMNMCKYLTSIYVSGWQCSSTHVPSSHEPGPDFADYPMDTVPNKV